MRLQLSYPAVNGLCGRSHQWAVTCGATRRRAGQVEAVASRCGKPVSCKEAVKRGNRGELLLGTGVYRCELIGVKKKVCNVFLHVFKYC